MTERDPDRQRRVLQLFEESLDVPADERRAFLRERTYGNPDLLREIEGLIAVEESEAALDPIVVFPAYSEVLESPGRTRRIGAYELGEPIGAGGMGEVFLARRIDGTFDRTVAVKRVRPGLDSGEVLSRFRRERRVLAALVHPNIARLIDAGADADGVPYLVMEYVDGVPIDRYCDAAELDVRERIGIFVKVCGAVEHAHKNGVIHRDLKPGNILVGPDGDPKLLDFGLAGVLSPEKLGGDLTLTTDSLGYMTPSYASPEQFRRATIRPPSDQYSLAVVLYELLTGRLPHDLSSLSPAEMERLVNDEPPAPPSYAVDGGAASRQTDYDAVECARRRRTTSKALGRTLRGDLDRIVMMALRVDPSRRYASVHDFAEDLRRFVDGRPVRAQRDTVIYRATRFVQRNRIPVAATAAVLVALSIALVITLGSLEDAKVARADAERERSAAERAQADAERGLADAEVTAGFLTEMLSSGDPWHGSRDQTVRDVVDRSAAGVEERFGERPLIAGRIHQTIGRVYAHLGVLDPALEHAERALEIFGARLAEEDPRYTDTLYVLAVIHKTAGRLELAHTVLMRRFEILRRVRGDEDVEVFAAQNDIGGVYRAQNRLAEAETWFRAAVGGITRVAGSDSPRLCEPLNNLGFVLLIGGRFEEAGPLLERALELHLRRDPDHPNTLITRGNVAQLRHKQGRVAEAETLYRDVLARSRAVMGPDHPETLTQQVLLARTLADQRNFAEAITLVDDALDRRRRSSGELSLDVAETMLNCAEYRFRTGRLGEAEPIAYEALVLLEATAERSSLMWSRALRAYSVIMHHYGRFELAIDYLERALAFMRRHHEEDPFGELRRAHWDLGMLHGKAGGSRVARAMHYAAWLELQPDERERNGDDALFALHNAGGELLLAGGPERAEPYLLESYVRHCDRFGPVSPKLEKPIVALIALYERLRPEEVWRWKARLGTLDRASPAGED